MNKKKEKTPDELIKAKEEVSKRLAGCVSTVEGLKQQRKEFSYLIDHTDLTQIQEKYYKAAISELEKLINNPLDICLTQGIDTMMIDIIQLRAMMYACESLDENQRFIQTQFFNNWRIGMTYAVFSLFGKLMDKNNDVESLFRIWNYAYKNSYFIDDHTKAINKWMQTRGQTIGYRHKVIAHNAKNNKKRYWINYDGWKQFDNDIKQLVSAWSCLSKFSGSMLALPFKSGEEIFNELGFIFKSDDTNILVEKYNMFITELCKDCGFLHTISVKLTS